MFWAGVTTPGFLGFYRTEEAWRGSWRHEIFISQVLLMWRGWHGILISWKPMMWHSLSRGLTLAMIGDVAFSLSLSLFFIAFFLFDLFSDAVDYTFFLVVLSMQLNRWILNSQQQLKIIHPHGLRATTLPWGRGYDRLGLISPMVLSHEWLWLPCWLTLSTRRSQFWLIREYIRFKIALITLGLRRPLITRKIMNENSEYL